MSFADFPASSEQIFANLLPRGGEEQTESTWVTSRARLHRGDLLSAINSLEVDRSVNIVIAIVKPECETKCKLLRVAMQLIWESSYGSVSVDDICRQAGVNKGSFYYFFPSKSDLAVAALEADWQERLPSLDQIFSPLTPPMDRIANYCAALIDKQRSKQRKFGKVCGCPNITLGSELSTQDENIRRKTAEIMARYVQYFEAAVRDAMFSGLICVEDAHTSAEELFAYSQGLLLQAKLRNDLTPFQGLESGMRRLLGLPRRPALKRPSPKKILTV